MPSASGTSYQALDSLNRVSDDRRHLARWRLVYNLQVFDADTGSLMGHAVDITTQGLLLVSSTQPEVPKIYHLEMVCAGPGQDTEKVAFLAESRWTRRAVDVGFSDTGFRLVNTHPRVVERISSVIEALRAQSDDGPLTERNAGDNLLLPEHSSSDRIPAPIDEMIR
jgi:hypothetical protein